MEDLICFSTDEGGVERRYPRRSRPEQSDERGLTTAELLANAALGVGALAAIWVALQGVGVDIVDWIRAQLL